MCLRCLLVVFGLIVLSSSANPEEAAGDCMPSYFEFREPLRIVIDNTEASFKMLVIGCQEDLGEVWPPDKAQVEQVMAPFFQESHPLKTLLDMRERPSSLRSSVASELNEKIFKKRVVFDVFFYEGKFTEY